LPELICFQAEANTAMFTIYSKLRSDGYTASVVLDTEDTDNYVQATYVAQQTPGILCLKRKQKRIDAKRLCSEEMSETIIPLHVISGCDYNSGFYGASKKLITDRLMKSKEECQLLSECGLQITAQQKVIQDLQLFVIRFIMVTPKARL